MTPAAEFTWSIPALPTNGVTMLHRYILDRLPRALPNHNGETFDIAGDLATIAADAWQRITDTGPDAGVYPTRVHATADPDGVVGLVLVDDAGSSTYSVEVDHDGPGDCYTVRTSASGTFVQGDMRWTVPADMVHAPEPAPVVDPNPPHELESGLFVALVRIAEAYVDVIGGDVSCMLIGLRENLEERTTVQPFDAGAVADAAFASAGHPDYLESEDE